MIFSFNIQTDKPQNDYKYERGWLRGGVWCLRCGRSLVWHHL